MNSRTCVRITLSIVAVLLLFGFFLDYKLELRGKPILPTVSLHAKNGSTTVTKEEETTSEGLTTVTEEIKPTSGGLTTVTEEVKTTSGAFETVTEEVARTSEGLTTVTEEVKPTSGGLTTVTEEIKPTFGELTNVAEEAATTSEGLTTVTKEVKATPGGLTTTKVPKHSTPTELSENSTGVVQELQSTSDGNSSSIVRRISENAARKSSRSHTAKTGNEEKQANVILPTATKTVESSRVCPTLSLTPTTIPEYGTCKPHQATEESCRLAQEYYYLEPELTKCKQLTQEICKMRADGSRKVSCHATLCKQGQRASFVTQSLDPRKGSVTVTATFRTAKELEDGLPKIIEENRKNKFNFVFLNCTKRDGGKVMQLLPTDPRLTIAEHPAKRRDENIINVNVILIDSLSRAHFYRSLPQTIATFSKWTADKSPPAEIFDFELFQAVHGHTTENTHALFTGKLIPLALKGKKNTVEAGVLFGRFKKAGYQTMWQEDLCWKGIWGLMLDLRASGWLDLQKKLTSSSIDSTGLTHSCCELLSSLNIKSPFYGPDQICYNGKFQHSYYLQYTRDMLQAINTSPKAKPLLSYMALNVPHDHRGRRTQTLDLTLTDYVTAMSQDSKTLTIILADHGNTYTTYTNKVPEGRFEMFHPSLFVIVPNRVAKLLGEKAMSALRVNQQRLVTIIELHHSLMTLAGPLKGGVRPQGLFKPMSVNRTCDDLELRLPNLCVCDGWELPANNDSLRVALVNFAVGQLNNRVQEQYAMKNKGKSPALRACARLVPIRFEKVRERNLPTDGSLITSFDIYVKAGDVVEQGEDIFNVHIKSKELKNKESMDLTLLNYDRVSMFGKYKVCADPGVEPSLCVCSRKRSVSITNSKKQLEAVLLQDFKTDFGRPPDIKAIGSMGCLYLIERAYNDKGHSFAYEIGNFCDETFEVAFDVESTNMKLSRAVPFDLKISPGRLVFVLSAKKHVESSESDISTHVKVKKR